MANKLLNRGA